MLVLLAPGTVLGWKAVGVFRSLAGGIALTILAMLILLPYQDIGWGYRYVHGLIGSAALLATLGWTRLTEKVEPSERGNAWGVMAITTRHRNIQHLSRHRAGAERPLTAQATLDLRH